MFKGKTRSTGWEASTPPSRWVGGCARARVWGGSNPGGCLPVLKMESCGWVAGP